MTTGSTTGSTTTGNTVSALERGISVLRAFTEDRRVLSHTELAQITGIPRPTVTRLAATLIALGLIRHEADGERYMLGAGVVSLARVFLAGLDIRATARPAMQALAEQVGASVYLAVRDGLEMVLVEACRPRSSIMSTRLDVGSRAPLATSALGRAYLHACGADTRNGLLESLRLARGSEWDALEPGLVQSLEDADAHGYSLSLGEFHREINSVSVPLMGPDREVMALNCGGAAFMFDEQRLREQIAPRLIQLATRLAIEIGGADAWGKPSGLAKQTSRAKGDDQRGYQESRA